MTFSLHFIYNYQRSSLFVSVSSIWNKYLISTSLLYNTGWVKNHFLLKQLFCHIFKQIFLFEMKKSCSNLDLI